MLLSQNVRNLTSYQLETYSNREVIAVGQDPLGRQGMRLVGAAITSAGTLLTPLTIQSCNGGADQVWAWNVTAPEFLTNPDSGLCANVDNCGTDLIAYHCVTSGGTCAGPTSYANEEFVLRMDGTLRSALSADTCVTSFGTGHPLALSPCKGTPAQLWKYDSGKKTLSQSGGCITVGGTTVSTNVWGRPLMDGGWAVAFLNAESTPVSMTCSSECLGMTGWDQNQVIHVRDLWAKMDLAPTTVSKGVSVSNVEANGGISLLKLTPFWKSR